MPAMTAAIDLDFLTNDGQVHNLSGHNRGLEARGALDLDKLDVAAEPVDVAIPDHIYSISPSFVQGLFSASVKAFGNNPSDFFGHYRIQASDLVRRQIERAMSNITMGTGLPRL
jgi:hypothetical protein